MLLSPAAHLHLIQNACKEIYPGKPPRSWHDRQLRSLSQDIFSLSRGGRCAVLQYQYEDWCNLEPACQRKCFPPDVKNNSCLHMTDSTYGGSRCSFRKLFGWRTRVQLQKDHGGTCWSRLSQGRGWFDAVTVPEQSSSAWGGEPRDKAGS